MESHEVEKLFSGTEAVCDHLPFRVRALLDAWLLSDGRLGPMDQVSHSAGFRSRFELNRTLQREGLPSLRRTRNWMRILAWVDRWERTGQPLCSQVLSSGLDPSNAYHLIKRLTGSHWRQVTERGSSWILNRFLSERPHSRLERDVRFPSPSAKPLTNGAARLPFSRS